MKDPRIAALRRLAASTTFAGERESALKKAAELEAREPAPPPLSGTNDWDNFRARAGVEQSDIADYLRKRERGVPSAVAEAEMRAAQEARRHETAYQRYWARRTAPPTEVYVHVDVDTTLFDFAVNDIQELFKVVQAQHMRDIASAFGVPVEDIRSTPNGYEVDVS